MIGLVADPAVLAEARGLVDEEGRVYRELTLESERAVAATLARRLAAPAFLDHDPGESCPDEETTEEQWAAVRGAFGSRVSVLTGGPGVGKTAAPRRS